MKQNDTQEKGSGREINLRPPQSRTGRQTVTPGPWVVAGLRDDDTLCVVQQSTGGVICNIESTFAYATADEMNASLIAAAPELLTALKLAVSSLNAPGFVNATVRMAEAAIAKAEVR